MATFIETATGGMILSGQAVLSYLEGSMGVTITGNAIVYGLYPLRYKLEYTFDDTTRSDSSVFIHFKQNVPIYQTRIDKEDYDISITKHPFLTGLFNISGVTELSTKAYRIWLMKSPIFSWEEVLYPVLWYCAFWYQHDSLAQLPGSANPDGTGFTLPDPKQRRKI